MCPRNDADGDSRHACSDVAARTHARTDYLVTLMNTLRASVTSPAATVGGTGGCSAAFATVESPHLRRLKTTAMRILARAGDVTAAGRCRDGGKEGDLATTTAGPA